MRYTIATAAIATMITMITTYIIALSEPGTVVPAACDAALSPTALTAVTLYQYVCPDVRPVSV
jgi:hypothetical protein